MTGRKVFALVLTTAWLAILLGPPTGDGLPLFPHFDKIAHLGGFWALGAAWRRCVSRLASLAIGLALGVLSELGQSLVPWPRTADVYDLAFDAVGVLLGVLTIELWVSIKNRRAQH